MAEVTSFPILLATSQDVPSVVVLMLVLYVLPMRRTFTCLANHIQCTGQSGILSYKEIMQIIDKNDITATWDEVAAVKYITWNDDQWVSFDDKETFQQKIKWANSNGIGGLAIWALDQDTDDLEVRLIVLRLYCHYLTW